MLSREIRGFVRLVLPRRVLRMTVERCATNSRRVHPVLLVFPLAASSESPAAASGYVNDFANVFRLTPSPHRATARRSGKGGGDIVVVTPRT